MCVYEATSDAGVQPTQFEMRQKNEQFANRVRSGKTAVKPSRQERLEKRSPISLWALGAILFVVLGGGTCLSHDVPRERSLNSATVLFELLRLIFL